jgi:hypothetical protein
MEGYAAVGALLNEDSTKDETFVKVLGLIPFVYDVDTVWSSW